jgi:hypothetical protein
MTKDEALKLALETLECWQRNEDCNEPMSKILGAIKEALAQPEHEPIGQLCEESYGRGQVIWFNKPVDGSYVYTTPPQRTWVGLTELEKAEITSLKWWDWEDTFDIDGFIKAIEAKLKEKNND